jgi:hypothetical protein
VAAEQHRPLRCNFCSKSQKEVKHLVAGPEAHICNECINLCVDVLDEHSPPSKRIRQRAQPRPNDPPLHVPVSFGRYRVLALRAYLKYSALASRHDDECAFGPCPPSCVQRAQKYLRAMRRVEVIHHRSRQAPRRRPVRRPRRIAVDT